MATTGMATFSVPIPSKNVYKQATSHFLSRTMKSKFQQAYEAFHRALPDLLAQGKHGFWALYHGETQIALSDNRDQLYQIATERRLLEEDILVDLIAAEPEDIDSEVMRFR
jgi:hypothetical protein